MKAEKFRQGREEVERIIGSIYKDIKAGSLSEPSKRIEQAQQIVFGLAEGANGEIQNRSVDNMNLKIKSVEERIEKIPVKKAAKKRIKKT